MNTITSKAWLPVLRPKLPLSSDILTYLTRIDESRVYSNFGPLAIEFEDRIGKSLGLAAGCFVSANSGTSALVGAILAITGRAHQSRPYAVMPSYTFVATAHAIEQCGFTPLLVDVDRDAWALTASDVERLTMLDRVGLVVPVAPYGRPVMQASWEDFQSRTNIPVVIDGAASFFPIGEASNSKPYIGTIPVVFSFHATKSFGVGEGGGVASTNPRLVEQIRRALNFGFFETRNSACASINGKLSEYHAAVGLAELDGWEQKRSHYRRVADCYRKRFAAAGLSACFFGAPVVDGSYALFLSGSPEYAAEIERSLRLANIDYRYWYGKGIGHHDCFSKVLHSDLTITEHLGSCLIGLPVALDMSDCDVARVVDAVCEPGRIST